MISWCCVEVANRNIAKSWRVCLSRHFTHLYKLDGSKAVYFTQKEQIVIMNSYEEFRTGPFNVQLIVFNNTNIILYSNFLRSLAFTLSLTPRACAWRCESVMRSHSVKTPALPPELSRPLFAIFRSYFRWQVWNVGRAHAAWMLESLEVVNKEERRKVVCRRQFKTTPLIGQICGKVAVVG